MNKRKIAAAFVATVFLLAPVASQARWMNPNTGRFWTMDTFVGNNHDPLSLHKYAYSRNNPLTYLDPNGNDPVEEMAWVDSRLGGFGGSPGRIAATHLATLKFSPLGKKLLDHFMDGTGTTITLTEDEMAECRVRIDLRESQEFQNIVMHSTGQMGVTDLRMLLLARNSGTLHHFFGVFNGKVTGTTGANWKFAGTVNFEDTYKFDPQPWNFPNTSSYNPNGRDPDAEFQTRAANFWIPGKQFEVRSVAAPLSQSYSDTEAQWKGTGMASYYVSLF